MLRDSLLDPKCHILLIVTINPLQHQYDETFNSLVFANKIKNLKVEKASRLNLFKPITTKIVDSELQNMPQAHEKLQQLSRGMIFKPRRVIQSNQRRSNSEQRQRANIYTANANSEAALRSAPVTVNTLFKGKATNSQSQLPRNITTPATGVQNDLYMQLNENIDDSDTNDIFVKAGDYKQSVTPETESGFKVPEKIPTSFVEGKEDAY